MRVILETLGCKLNQAETEMLAWQLSDAGYQLVSDIIEADICVLNTCSVTAMADTKSRHLVRYMYRRNPKALIVVCGCYAEIERERLMQMPGVTLVVCNEDKSRILRLIEDHLLKRDDSLPRLATLQPTLTRTRSFIKVQEGCDEHCTYCIVPNVRGHERSVPMASIIATIRRRVADGFQEVVLTGTNVGSYHDEGCGLRGLLEAILLETGVSRLRLSSLQPQEVSPEILSLWHDPRLCRHFHLSLQSGCDETLQRMKRRYSVTQYRDCISMIRSLVPEAAITTDIIVGFPGESDAEFVESYSVCEELSFARIHVFPFSSRPCTEAAQLSGLVNEYVKKERCRKMLALAHKSARDFRATFQGKSRPVLWESKDSNGCWIGLTDNYILTKTCSTSNLHNQIGMAVIR